MSHNPSTITREELKTLVNAAKTDSLETIKRFPRAYLDMVKHRCNDDLLHIVVYSQSKRVFDYLLSLPDYPIDNINTHGETPLEVAVQRSSTEFASILLERGANVHHVNPITEEPLLETPFSKVTATVSKPQQRAKYEKIIQCLLSWGVNAISRNDNFHYFELAVKFGSLSLAESMFLYNFDTDTLCPKMSVGVLILLASRKCWYFYEVLGASEEIVIVADDDRYTRWLFSMQADYLDALIIKCGTLLEDLMMCHESILYAAHNLTYTPLDDSLSRSSLDDLNVLFNSKLSECFINCLKSVFSPWVFTELSEQYRQSKVTQFFCFLMSYGMDIDEQCMHTVYRRYGLCELFQIMTHMDVRESVTIENKEIIPSLVCDMSVDLDYVIKNFTDYSTSVKSLIGLLSFSALPKVKRFCLECSGSDEIVETIRRLPDVPLLQELTRNVIKKNLVEKHNFKSSRDYCTFVRKLPIGSICKEIVRFIRPLY